jgi:hypothetical protein
MLLLSWAVVAADAPASTTAGIVTAIGTLFTALGGLLLAVGVLIPVLRNSNKTLEQTEKIHTIVNQQHTDQERYNIALTEALRAAGVPIPVDQSKPVLGHGDAQPGQPTDSN